MKVSIKQYSQTLFDLTDGKSEQDVLIMVQKFAEVLKNDGQLKNAAKIMEKYTELYNAANGIVAVEVITGSGMEQATRDKVEKFIMEKYGAKKIEMSVVVDEKIQGGIIIRVGDEILDASIQKQLINLKKVLSS